ncbi:MAG: LytTR family transcriptional regulator [Rhodobacteraceae bacterium]|nr:LytTR family transcriptional regulator [Paracoccaceae bacterium]
MARIKIFLHAIRNATISARQNVSLAQTERLRKIEKFYDKALNEGRYSLRASIQTGWHFYIFNVLSIEFIFIFVVMFVTLVSSGAIGSLGREDPLVNILYWIVIVNSLFTTIFVVTTGLVILHLKYTWSLIRVVVVSAPISAGIVSLVAPLISWYVFAVTGPTFFQLYPPLLALILFAQLFLHVKNNGKLCYRNYEDKMRGGPGANIFSPDINGDDILVLSAQDHYVEIITSAGKSLTRMRLSEAIELTNGKPGALVHRSHWVAQEAIQHMELVNDKHVLFLTNGSQIRVSASKLKEVTKLIVR